jgi:hypothetical protein
MIPVEVTQTPWHYHWQTGLVGAGAVIAATATVWAMWSQTATTVRLERERVLSELVALRMALGVELRTHISRAFGVYGGLQELSMSGEPITARMVESKSRMAAPIIYPANAGKIGLLGAGAMDVVIVYDLLEIARDGAARLMTFRTPDDISPAVVYGVAQTFLAACSHARGVLPKLRTGDPSRDAKDGALIQQINAAISAPQPAAFVSMRWESSARAED